MVRVTRPTGQVQVLPTTQWSMKAFYPPMEIKVTVPTMEIKVPVETREHSPSLTMRTREEVWAVIEDVIPHSRRTLLHGIPGTGKSTVGMKHAVPKSGAYAITLTEDTPMSELRGHFTVVDGNFKWFDGVGIRAWREGARLVINEIDHAPPEVQTFLHALLDDETIAEYTLPTGERVRPAPGFQVIATMNGHPFDLQEALRDRFPVTIEVTYVHPEALAQLSTKLRPHAARAAETTDAKTRIGLRQWLEYERLAVIVGSATAAKSVFGTRTVDVVNALRMSGVDV